MPTRSTLGLCPERLAKLLDVGSIDVDDGGRSSPSKAAADLMRRRFGDPLHIEGRAESVTAVLGGPCGEMAPGEGRPLGDVLLDPDTPLEILETIKQYGKALASRWDEGPEHVVAVTIYYAAIAAALSFHRRKITSRSRRELSDSLRVLMNDQWIIPGLARLFDTVHTLCEADE